MSASVMRQRGAASGLTIDQHYWSVWFFDGDVVCRCENFTDEASARAAASREA